MAGDLVDSTFVAQIKDFGAWIVALVGALGTWWAWKTNVLKTMGDRIAALEARVDNMSSAESASQLRLAEQAGEIKSLLRELASEKTESAMWKARYLSRRERHTRDSTPGGVGSLESPSDCDADDDIAAEAHIDLSGEFMIRKQAGE